MGSKRCINCGQPITASFTADDGYIIWTHENQHTVCDWREGMDPTSRVATPIEGDMPPIWNVAVRDANGGVRAEFAIYATTLAGAMREAAPNLVDYREMCAVEITKGR